MKKKLSPHWKKDSDKHDYSAAASFLTLLMEPDRAKEIAARFKKTPVSTFLVKDLLRASRLPLLPTDNFHVKKDLRKVKEGSLFSPVLLVRGEIEVRSRWIALSLLPTDIIASVQATISMRMRRSLAIW